MTNPLPFGPKALTDYTATAALQASTTAPVLGTGGKLKAGWAMWGGLCYFEHCAKFAAPGASPTAPNAGSGIYYVPLPFAAAVDQQTLGLTSQMLFSSVNILRAYSSLDVIGAHYPGAVMHIDPGNPQRALVVVQQPAGTVELDQVVSNPNADDTFTSSTPADISGMSFSYTPPMAGMRIELEVEVSCYSSAAGNTLGVSLNVGGSEVRRRGVTSQGAAVPGFGIGFETITARYIDENPPIGVARTYKAQAFTTGGTMTVPSHTFPMWAATARLRRLPGSSLSGLSEQSDYVGATFPFKWAEQPSGAQLWTAGIFRPA